MNAATIFMIFCPFSVTVYETAIFLAEFFDLFASGRLYKSPTIISKFRLLFSQRVQKRTVFEAQKWGFALQPFNNNSNY